MIWIEWREPSIRGYVDVFFPGEFVRGPLHGLGEHAVLTPRRALAGFARYRFAISGNRATLDYTEFRQHNVDEGMVPGIMTLVFADGSRRQVREVLWQDTWRHPARPADAVQIPAEQSEPRRRGTDPGQGSLTDSATRRAIEWHAMCHAMRHYKGQGWRVEDVSARSSYDLRCTRGAEILRVEVKGTTRSPESVQVTRHELATARKHHVALYIVHSIRLRSTGDGLRPSKGTVLHIDRWDVDAGRTEILTARWYLPRVG